MVEHALPGSDTQGYPEHDLVIHSDHVYIRFKAEINLRTQMALVDLIMDVRRARNLLKFIVDTRGCALNYSITDRYDLGTYYAEKAKNEIVLATIIDKEHLTGLVENVAHNRGATKLAIVTSDAEARNWIDSF